MLLILERSCWFVEVGRKMLKLWTRLLCFMLLCSSEIGLYFQTTVCPLPLPRKSLSQQLVCAASWGDVLFVEDSGTLRGCSQTLADVCFHCRLFIGRCGMNWVLLDWSKKNKPAPSDPPERGTDLRADKSRVGQTKRKGCAAYALSCVAWSQSGTSWRYSSWRRSSGAGPSPSNWRHRERHHQRAQI